MWILELVDVLPFVNLDRYGIRPRSVAGLVGIVCTPFLHLGLGHLAANSIPFVVLGAFVFLGGRRTFWSVTAFVVLIGGFGVWLFAPKFTNHLGASGLIFGYLGFLLARGIFAKSAFWILTSCAVLGIYGGLLFGVLPHEAGISWQGHLFGLVGGIVAARLLIPRRARFVP